MRWQTLFGPRCFIGLPFITPPYLFVHWEYWSGEGRNKKVRKSLWLIWQQQFGWFRNREITSSLIMRWEWWRKLRCYFGIGVWIELKFQHVCIMNGVGIQKIVLLDEPEVITVVGLEERGLQVLFSLTLLCDCSSIGDVLLAVPSMGILCLRFAPLFLGACFANFCFCFAVPLANSVNSVRHRHHH